MTAPPRDGPAQLQAHVSALFPELSAKADRAFFDYWGHAPGAQDAYSWFGSLASALNADMNRAVDAGFHAPVLDCIADALDGCSTELFACLDVSFVENLFWRVSANKAAPYWQQMPEALKVLYCRFHGNAPLASG